MSKHQRKAGTTRTIEAVERTASIIEGLRDLQSAGVTELAEHVDISKSVVYNYLRTLQQSGLVVKSGTTYQLSLEFLDIGEELRHNKTLYQAAKPRVNDLAAESREFAHLFVPERGLIYCLHRAKGNNAVATTSRIGKPDYLHRTSAGKAILAHLDSERVNEILDTWGLPPKTENTITDRDKLETELERIRDRGVAISNEECINSARAVGAPVLGPEDKVRGAISLSGPTERLKEKRVEQELSELVTRTANYIEVAINTHESHEVESKYSPLENEASDHA